MIAMEHNGQTWELCSPCWREGRQPFKVGLIDKALAASHASEARRERRKASA